MILGKKNEDIVRCRHWPFTCNIAGGSGEGVEIFLGPNPPSPLVVSEAVQGLGERRSGAEWRFMYLQIYVVFESSCYIFGVEERNLMEG